MKKEDSNWIHLNIDSLPERFFTREDLQIQFTVKGCAWVDEWDANRHVIPLRTTEGYRYRYRLKSIETIDVTSVKRTSYGDIECIKPDGSKFMLRVLNANS